MWEWIGYRLAGESNDVLSGFRFEFGAPFSTLGCVAFLLAAGLGVGFWSHSKTSRLPRGWRYALAGLRAALILLALFLLFDPRIVAERTRSGARHVVLLFDDSRSMQIEGGVGRSRGERMSEIYQKESAEFEEELLKSYRLAPYRFGEAAYPIRNLEQLDFEATESRLIESIRQTTDELAGLDIAAVVLFSDGIENNASDSALSLADLPADIPVFTVGTDSEEPWRDIGLGTLTVQRTSFDKSPVILTAPVRATGLKGQKAQVEVLLSGRIVTSREFAIDDDDWSGEARFEFIPIEKEYLAYSVRVRLGHASASDVAILAEGDAIDKRDRVTQNNERPFLIDNRPKEYRVLYFAGRPNWENKFIKRAIEADDEIKMTSLIRISRAEKKFVFRGRRSGNTTNPLFEGFDGDRDTIRYDEAVFLRMGVESDAELAAGFPTHPAELYAYDLVIWGEIEKDFFSHDHLELMRDFVRKRGGSALFMGGTHSFTDGGYESTIIEGMLPVVLDASIGSYEASGKKSEMYFVRPTIEGSLNGAWSLDTDPAADRISWEELPQLAGLNRFALIRPGATVMAVTESDSVGTDGAPLFITQRYGEGKSAILATGSTWQWQMQLEEEDTRHERLWRQIVRSLVEDVADRVYPLDLPARPIVGHPVEMSVMVRDEVFEPREGVTTEFQLSSPAGTLSDLPVEESIRIPGLYSFSFDPEQDGLYRIGMKARRGDEKIAEWEHAMIVNADRREFEQAHYRPEFLKAIAERSGGEFFPLEKIDEIPDLIPRKTRDGVEIARLHLWQWPGFYFLLVIMAAIEWYYRRRKGLA